MDGNFLKSGEFEVMLSKGLGRHFAEDEKARLFQDAKHIADSSYLLDATNPNGLWFHQFRERNWLSLYGLLRQPVEQFAA